MFKPLKLILDIQELDIKMIRLMSLKRQRQKELQQLHMITAELKTQKSLKQEEIEKMDESIQEQEGKIDALVVRIKGLEEKQSSIKKIDEFNAMTQEMTAAEREKKGLEQEVMNLVDQKGAEEELLIKIEANLKTSEESGVELEKEIGASIAEINAEGAQLKEQRDLMAKGADKETMAIYERLLKNKRDRVIVPIENRYCSGCHIALTAQHENIVRKGENLVFCEHCSRIHFWQGQSEEPAEGQAAPRRRRRRAPATK